MVHVLVHIFSDTLRDPDGCSLFLRVHPRGYISFPST